MAHRTHSPPPTFAALSAAAALCAILGRTVAISSSGNGAKVVEKAIGLHSERLDNEFQLYYIKATQEQYTSWIMMAIPIALYASAALLVEFRIFLSGEIIAILTSFTGARSSLVSLCSMREEIKVAVDLICDLSRMLCIHGGRTLQRIRPCTLGHWLH